MNKRLELYLLSRERLLNETLLKASKSNNESLMMIIHGSLQEIELIFAIFGYSKKKSEE